MIRYQIVGKKHDHTFRIILTEKRTSPHGKMQEILGFYNPKTKETKLKKERILYWIGKGAQPSATIWNLLIKNGIIKGAKKPIPSAKYKPPSAKAEEIKPKENQEAPAALEEKVPATEETTEEETINAPAPEIAETAEQK